MEQRELAFGRRLVRLGEFDQRGEEVAFVLVLGVAAIAAPQAGSGNLQRFQRQVAQGAAAERRLQRMPRHAVA